MATNEILPFAQGVTANLPTQAEYAADAERSTGNVPGPARSKLNNKAIRQATAIAAGLAQWMADKQATNITDALTPAQLSTILTALISNAFTPWTGATGATQLSSGGTAQQPASPVEGMLRYNTDLDVFEGYSNGLWSSIGGGAAGGDVFGPASSVNNQIALFNGTTGKLIKAGSVVGTAAAANIQASENDATNNAVLVVGRAFGLGATTVTSINDWALLPRQAGLYFIANGAANLPAGMATGHHYEVLALPRVNGGAQQYIAAGSNGVVVYNLKRENTGNYTDVRGFAMEATSPKFILAQETTSANGFGMGSNLTADPRTFGALIQIAATAPGLAVFWNLTGMPANTTFTWSVWYGNYATNPVDFYFQVDVANTKCHWADGQPPNLTGSSAILTFTAVNNGSSIICFAFVSGNNMLKQP